MKKRMCLYVYACHVLSVPAGKTISWLSTMYSEPSHIFLLSSAGVTTTVICLGPGGVPVGALTMIGGEPVRFAGISKQSGSKIKPSDEGQRVAGPKRRGESTLKTPTDGCPPTVTLESEKEISCIVVLVISRTAEKGAFVVKSLYTKGSPEAVILMTTVPYDKLGDKRKKKK